MPILQQRRNIALSINIQAAQSHTKHIDPSQNSLLDTPLHSREKKSISTHQNTDTSFPNQETLTSQSSNPMHWVKSPQWKGTTDHQNSERPLSTHSNLNKMKRQRNTQQVKEHEKCPPSQTKEEEIGNLPKKECRIMIIKMIQKPWKQNGVTDKYSGDKDWENARNV